MASPGTAITIAFFMLPQSAIAQEHDSDALAKQLSNPVAALISVPFQVGNIYALVALEVCAVSDQLVHLSRIPRAVSCLPELTLILDRPGIFFCASGGALTVNAWVSCTDAAPE